jgi:phosphoribosylaminoimidazole (AIR) synthetase
VNVGIGYAFVVPPGQGSDAVQALDACGHRAWRIGEVSARGGGDAVVYAG